MNHIPTLTLVYYKQEDCYGYRYDDVNGNTQENGVFPTLDQAAGDAFRNLRAFTKTDGIEEV